MSGVNQLKKQIHFVKKLFEVIFATVMKKALVYLLLIATMLPCISPWGTIAYYHLNRDYIARVLCENRDKPQLHCDGKCFLAKRLKAQQDKQDKETTERVENTPSISLFIEAGFSFSFGIRTVAELQSSLFIYLIPALSPHFASLFKPPRF